MPRIIEKVVSIFGDKTPSHRLRGSVDGNTVHIDVEIQQPDNPVTVTYKPGISIHIEGENGYRPFREEEVLFAGEIHFFGQGMSNGRTIDGKYFKALDDPLEVNPLEIIED